MALTLAAATAAAAGAGLLGQGVNAYSTGRMNRKSMAFSREMYARQRADALSDWNMQNAYNDPAQQMARLKGAGLNPHLVYGNGATATTSSQPRSADVKSPSFNPPKVDLGSVVFNAMQMKQLHSNIARTDAETASIMAKTKEQNYRNAAFTPELFAKELEAKIESIQSGAYSARMSGDLANQRADIAQLELENQNLISGRFGGSTRHVSGESTTRANMVYDKFKAEINNVLSRTQNLQQATSNLTLDAALKKFEVDLIHTLGLNQTMATQVMGNLMKLFLLKSR